MEQPRSTPAAATATAAPAGSPAAVAREGSSTPTSTARSLDEALGAGCAEGAPAGPAAADDATTPGTASFLRQKALLNAGLGSLDGSSSSESAGVEFYDDERTPQSTPAKGIPASSFLDSRRRRRRGGTPSGFSFGQSPFESAVEDEDHFLYEEEFITGMGMMGLRKLALKHGLEPVTSREELEDQLLALQTEDAAAASTDRALFELSPREASVDHGAATERDISSSDVTKSPSTQLADGEQELSQSLVSTADADIEIDEDHPRLAGAGPAPLEFSIDAQSPIAMIPENEEDSDSDLHEVGSAGSHSLAEANAGPDGTGDNSGPGPVTQNGFSIGAKRHNRPSELPVALPALGTKNPSAMLSAHPSSHAAGEITRKLANIHDLPQTHVRAAPGTPTTEPLVPSTDLPTVGRPEVGRQEGLPESEAKENSALAPTSMTNSPGGVRGLSIATDQAQSGVTNHKGIIKHGAGVSLRASNEDAAVKDCSASTAVALPQGSGCAESTVVTNLGTPNDAVTTPPSSPIATSPGGTPLPRFLQKLVDIYSPTYSAQQMHPALFAGFTDKESEGAELERQSSNSGTSTQAEMSSNVSKTALEMRSEEDALGVTTAGFSSVGQGPGRVDVVTEGRDEVRMKAAGVFVSASATGFHIWTDNRNEHGSAETPLRTTAETTSSTNVTTRPADGSRDPARDTSKQDHDSVESFGVQPPTSNKQQTGTQTPLLLRATSTNGDGSIVSRSRWRRDDSLYQRTAEQISSTKLANRSLEEHSLSSLDLPVSEASGAKLVAHARHVRAQVGGVCCCVVFVVVVVVAAAAAAAVAVFALLVLGGSVLSFQKCRTSSMQVIRDLAESRALRAGKPFPAELSLLSSKGSRHASTTVESMARVLSFRDINSRQTFHRTVDRKSIPLSSVVPDYGVREYESASASARKVLRSLSTSLVDGHANVSSAPAPFEVYEDVDEGGSNVLPRALFDGPNKQVRRGNESLGLLPPTPSDDVVHHARKVRLHSVLSMLVNTRGCCSSLLMYRLNCHAWHSQVRNEVAAEIEKDRIAFLAVRQERQFRAEKKGQFVDTDTQVRGKNA